MDDVTHIPFDLDFPKRSKFSIHDIASVLSKKCFFNHEFQSFYSIAQHCIRLSKQVSPNLAYEALFYLSDYAFMDNPSKDDRSLILSELYERFDLTFPIPREVERSHIVLQTQEKIELNSLITYQGKVHLTDPLLAKLQPQSSDQAEIQFMKRFDEIRKNARTDLDRPSFVQRNTSLVTDAS